MYDDVNVDYLNRPYECEMCGGNMIFKGVGEYRCEDCRYIAFDDYGKTRLYIEQHRGATAAEIESGTGVKQKNIREMVRDGRLEIAAESKVFFRCDRCGVNIRMGRYCAACEKEVHQLLEEERRTGKRSVSGFGLGPEGEIGEKRFNRDGR